MVSRNILDYCLKLLSETPPFPAIAAFNCSNSNSHMKSYYNSCASRTIVAVLALGRLYTKPVGEKRIATFMLSMDGSPQKHETFLSLWQPMASWNCSAVTGQLGSSCCLGSLAGTRLGLEGSGLKVSAVDQRAPSFFLCTQFIILFRRQLSLARFLLATNRLPSFPHPLSLSLSFCCGDNGIP